MLLLCGWLDIWRSLFAAMNCVALGLYGFDKLMAMNKGQRVPEVVLLSVAATGGSPGSILGQLIFRHKTAKLHFQRAFWSIVFLQILLLVGLILMRTKT